MGLAWKLGTDTCEAQLVSIAMSLVQKHAPTQSRAKLHCVVVTTDKRTDTLEAEPISTRRFLQNSPDSFGVRQVSRG